jgi:CRISPR-associated protein Csx3
MMCGTSMAKQGSPAAAIAFYDPRLGAVVVATHSQEWQVGQVVDVTLPVEK